MTDTQAAEVEKLTRALSVLNACLDTVTRSGLTVHVCVVYEHLDAHLVPIVEIGIEHFIWQSHK